ncbi:hypothetical protein [Sphingorhabdus sp.]|jgi:hypothetical protein|uniref:hypothetical protein n=1 Tax=Sphingorhabdus sp. TaxID=1902408 RepID=UPI002D1FBCF3|nr:hypothetical protein [Sphingorhabdus sp.]
MRTLPQPALLVVVHEGCPLIVVERISSPLIERFPLLLVTAKVGLALAVQLVMTSDEWKKVVLERFAPKPDM